MPHNVQGLRTRRQLILLVDGNEIIRQVVSTILSVQGFRVLVAPTASEAFRIVDRFSRRLDLVIADAAMRDSARFDLLRQVSMLRLPLLLMSNQPPEKHDPGMNYIVKPFTQAVLVSRLRGLLETRADLRETSLYKTAALGR